MHFVEPVESLDKDKINSFILPYEYTNKITTVEPKRGRVAIFSSGSENMHYVERVLSGKRYVLAFWFTCDEDRKMEIYLDGEVSILL